MNKMLKALNCILLIALLGCTQANNGNDKIVGVPGKKYGQPCDKVLGNGNYVIHNFIGEKASLSYDTMEADVTYYLNHAKTYVMGQVNTFSDSLKNRPAAKEYFSNYINKQKSNSFALPEYHPDGSVDGVMNIMNNACEPIMCDIVRNIDTNYNRCLFNTYYKVIANEAKHFGYGVLRERGNDYTGYEGTRGVVDKNWNSTVLANPFDVNQDIDYNNCQRVTEEMDRLLKQAAQNIGNGVTAADLRNVVTAATFVDSFLGMHRISSAGLKHLQSSCVANMTIETAMSLTAREMRAAEQSNSLSF